MDLQPNEILNGQRQAHLIYATMFSALALLLLIHVYTTDMTTYDTQLVHSNLDSISSSIKIFQY